MRRFRPVTFLSNCWCESVRLAAALWFTRGNTRGWAFGKPIWFGLLEFDCFEEDEGLAALPRELRPDDDPGVTFSPLVLAFVIV